MGVDARTLALLEAALALSAGQREAFLDRECGADAAVRQALEALLAADAQAGGFLDPPPAAAFPDHVGPYRLLRELGQGGMGRVFLAERADALYQKQVAVKFLRHDQGDLRERFANERRILAALDHPAIARLVDAGYDDRGQPYVVMEYVDGRTLTQHADSADLSVRARIGLFLAVLDAVGHAHAQLVVHRDLKPENILVGADGVPKLLDFGIAKLLVPDASADTRTGLMAMTPEYASPEQVRGEPVSVASDVYSLGVLLFQLLTGARPYAITTRSPASIERIVCEVEAPRPSQVAEAQARAGIDRDLDHIVLKALAKDPRSRYRSCAQFGDDLRRFLEGRPVDARATPPLEVAGKFVRRHRVGVLASVAVIAALLIGAGFALAQAQRANVQARIAGIERDRAEAISTFLTDMLAAADPATGSRELTVVSLLDAAAESLDARQDADPAVTLAIRQTLARSYRSLGRLDAALAQALAAYESSPGAAPETRAQASLLLGQVYLERGDAAAAQPLLEEAAAVWAAQPEATLEQAAVDNLLGQLHSQAGRLEVAVEHYRRAIEQLRATPAAAGPRMAELLDNLAVTYGRAGRLSDAEGLHREALAIFRATRGADHPHTARSWFNLASVLEMRDDFDAADAAFGEVERIQRRHYGDRHPELAQTLASHAFLLNRAGRHSEAVGRARQAVAAASGLTPPQPISAYAQAMLGESLLLAGDATAALRPLRKALAQREQLLPDDHPVRLNSMSMVGAAEVAAGDRENGLPRMEDAAARLRATLGPDHEFTRRALARIDRHAPLPPAGSVP